MRDEDRIEENLQEVPKDSSVADDSSVGGKEKALEFLRLSLGEKKAKDFSEKLERSDVHKQFAELEKFSVANIVRVLSQEMEQTSALVLSQLSPALSAKVLSKLPKEKKSLVARRVAVLKEVSPQILEVVFQKIKEKLIILEEQEGLSSGGEQHLAAILRQLNVQAEFNIMEALEKDDPEMAERIQAQIYSFDELLYLNANEIRRLVEAISEQDIWAMALKGSGRELSSHILSALSLNRAADISDRMQELGAVPLKEIETHRREIMKKAEELEKEGIIFLRKDEEDFLE